MPLDPSLLDELDGGFVELLNLLNRDVPFGTVAASARGIIERYQSEHLEEGSKHVFHSLWEEYWREDEGVFNWSGDLPQVQENPDLEEPFGNVHRAMVQLILASKTQVPKEDHLDGLRRALRVYLDLRGYNVPSGQTPVSPSASVAPTLRYPPAARLVEIADAADGLAGDLRNYWILDGATSKQNPGRLAFPSDVLTADDKKRFVMKLDQLQQPRAKLNGLVEELSPGDFLENASEGLKKIRGAKAFQPNESALVAALRPGSGAQKPTARPVVGWGFAVQEAVVVLQECVRATLPDVVIPIEVVDRLEYAAQVLRAEAAKLEGGKLPQTPQEESPAAPVGAYTQGDGTGGNENPPESPSGQAFRLRPCDELARSQYNFAMKEDASLTTYQQAYDWLSECKSIDQLPVFSTWAVYLRRARKAYGESKNTLKAGNPTRSVVSSDKIEAQGKATRRARTADTSDWLARLCSLASDLYVAGSTERPILWKQVAEYLGKLGVADDRIAAFVSTNDSESLVKLIGDLDNSR